MRKKMPAAALCAALLIVAGLLSACDGTSGSPVAQVQSMSSSAASSTPGPTVTVTSTPPKTVTMTAQAPARVTRVVHAPNVPRSYGSLQGLLNSATVLDNSNYLSSGGDGVFFDSPSQNIGCYLTGSGTVECAIHDYDFPQNGPDCNSGIGAGLDGGGYPSLTDCSGYFPVANRGRVLPYGTALMGDDIACVSESFGISCLNRDSGTGFTLSKQAFSPVY